jgi:hypothetical protein
VIAPGVPFDQIAERDLLTLIENGFGERRTVEYKRELPRGTDADKREFLADASSFANAAGGDLLFGIDESDGSPTRLTPLTVSPDVVKLALESSVRDGVSPRIPGLQVRDIPVEGGFVLHLRIPRSWAGPHAVTYKGAFRFYGRTTAGKYPLDVGELRGAFLGGAEIADRIRMFRRDRIATILAGETPLSLSSSPKVILHLVPFEAFGVTPSLELNAAEGSGLFRPPFHDYPGTTRWNIDGLLTYARLGSEAALAYAQLFRNGVYEGVDAEMIGTESHSQFGVPFVYGYWLEKALNRNLANPLQVLQRIGVQTPLAVLVTVVGVEDYLLLGGERFLGQSSRRFDRDAIMLPDVLLADYYPADPRRELSRLMRPVVDAFWQAGGWQGSPDYDMDGNWQDEG